MRDLLCREENVVLAELFEADADEEEGDEVDDEKMISWDTESLFLCVTTVDDTVVVSFDDVMMLSLV